MLSCFYGLNAVGLIFGTILLNLIMKKFGEENKAGRNEFLAYQCALCSLAVLNFMWVASIPHLEKSDLSFGLTWFLLWANVIFEFPIILVVCFSHKATFSIQE
jgi:hypothetical protein